MKIFFTALLLSLAPHWAWACPVCFGEGGQNLARGFFWGILLLLLLPFALILTVTTKIVLATRKKGSLNPATNAY